jgi:apolipoprotein D and lipocalin family protein
MSGRRWLLAGLPVVVLLAACQGGTGKPVTTVESLDLERFMGDWYVVANIPTFIEKSAHNAVESYTLRDGGQVDTRFRFRDGGFDGPLKVYNPTGFVSDESNAVWGMQFLWPIKAEFLVLYVDDDYQRTIIGRSKRDYLWFMAREPDISAADYAAMLEVARDAGYDVSRIRPVPQQWPEET